MSSQPYLDNLLTLARECTGEGLPGNWESKGRAHRDGECGCAEIAAAALGEVPEDE